MKNLLLFILIYLSVIEALAQKPEIPDPELCGTPTPSVDQFRQLQEQIKNLSPKTNGVYLSSPVAIPIKAHIIRRSDGTGGLSTTVLNDAITTMNAQFASMNMSYYLCNGIHYINDDYFYDLDVPTHNSQLVLNNVNDAVNIYFSETLTFGSGGLNGISAFPSSDPLENRIIMRNDATANGTTLAHELGHYWNLYHTHETFYGNELVNGSNCTTAGDLVCDTPADPCCRFYNTSTCTYTGTGTDANGASYAPDLNNLMSYYQACRNTFSAGQFSRMDQGYALRLSLANGNYNFNCISAVAAAPSNVQILSADCNGLSVSWQDNATNELGYIVEIASSAAGPFRPVGRTAANATSFNGLVSFNGFSNVYVRVIAANSNAVYSLSTSTVAPTDCYCTPSSQNCSDDDQITNVKLDFGNMSLLNNSSGCSTNGYSLTNVSNSVMLEPGQTYTLSVSKLTRWSHGAVAWIDFDKDGIFESNEEILRRTSGTWGTYSQNFTVPTSVVSGDTRMRVRISYSSIPTNPCSNSSTYGETEDYILKIVSPCPSSRNLSGNITSEQLASGTISSSGVTTIPSGANVHIGAGNNVILNPGFSTANTAVFLADTNGCNN